MKRRLFMYFFVCFVMSTIRKHESCKSEIAHGGQVFPFIDYISHRLNIFFTTKLTMFGVFSTLVSILTLEEVKCQLKCHSSQCSYCLFRDDVTGMYSDGERDVI